MVVFLFLEKKIFKYLPKNNTMLERQTMKTLTKLKQLNAYKHYSFWQCMDTLRDKEVLNNIWKKKVEMVNLKLFNSIYKNKKVLITGHTGFKGTWLTLWLLLLGAKVCGFSNNQITKPSLFNILKIRKKNKDCRGDIANYAKISKVVKNFQPEIIFHLTTQSLVKKILY